MGKYHFRLEILKRVRETERDEQQMRLAESCQTNNTLQQQRVELSRQRNQLHQQQKAAIQGPQVDIDKLAAVIRYDTFLRAEENSMGEKQALVAKETEHRREDLVEANRHMRTLQLLETRRRTEHQQHELRQEAKQMDEAAMYLAWQTRSSRHS